MVFLFRSLKVCRNLNLYPLSTWKLQIAVYSNEATSSSQKTSSSQEPRYSSLPESPGSRSVSSKPAISLTFGEDVARKALRKNPPLLEETKWTRMETNLGQLHGHCLALSKIRLTSLVVATTMGGYALAPGAFEVSTFLACSLGTGLLSGTANAINQFFEVPFDAQMSRTRNRVLVRGRMTPAHAVIFAAASGVCGLTLLYGQVNGLVAALGAANLVLYTLIYTPMKRISILNTWVGSIVGAIPPLMGWAGCVGDIASPAAWIMSALLYAWQFPHFNALSWNLRPDYSRAGYRMMAVTDPGLCRRTAVRYTAVLMGLCYLAPVFEVTNWWFALASTPLNGYFLYLAWNFHRHSDSGSSRKLFRFSLLHLPVLMVLMLCTKKYWFSGKKQTDAIKREERDGGNLLNIFARLHAS